MTDASKTLDERIKEIMEEPIALKVMRDLSRPCLYGVSGPCFHLRCLEYWRDHLEIERTEKRGK